jgi:hypothetical protein
MLFHPRLAGDHRKECRLYLRYHLGQGSANGLKVVAWPGEDEPAASVPDLSPDLKREAVWGSFQVHSLHLPCQV